MSPVLFRPLQNGRRLTPSSPQSLVHNQRGNVRTKTNGSNNNNGPTDDADDANSTYSKFKSVQVSNLIVRYSLSRKNTSNHIVVPRNKKLLQADPKFTPSESEVQRWNNNYNSGTKTNVSQMEKPRFLQKLEDQSVVEGQAVKLTARVQGATTVRWIHNGKIIPNCPDFQQSFACIPDVSVEGDKTKLPSECSLRIADIFVEDGGRYICKAHNESGSALCSANLTVSERKHYRFKMSEKEDLIVEHPVAEQNGKYESGIDESLRQNKNETPEVIQPVDVQISTGTQNEVLTVLGSDCCRKVCEKEVVSELNHKLIDVNNFTVSDTTNVMSAPVNSKTHNAEDADLVCKNGLAQGNMESYSEEVTQLVLDKRTTSNALEMREPSKNLDSTTEVSFPASLVKKDSLVSDLINDQLPVQINSSEDECDAFSDDDELNPPEISKTCVSYVRNTEDSLIPKTPDEDMSNEVVDVLNSKVVNSTGICDDSAEVRSSPQVMGPAYVLALKGESVHLRIKVTGLPHPTITWLRAGKHLESNDRLYIEEKGEFYSVNIKNVNYDDNGRYTAKIQNEAGTVIHCANLSVEGPPEPPSRSPTASFNEVNNTISVSWSGSPYDGGSALTGYQLYISQDEEEWTLACLSKWLTATIPSPESGSSYRFRVQAENAYGLGPPSNVSIPVVVQQVSSPSPETSLSLSSGNGGENCEQRKDTPIILGSYLELYEKGEELGKGRFGTVFKVTHKVSKKEFASKIIRCIKATDKDKVRQEVEIMNLLRHPKLIELVDAFETAREIVIITEKINGGELFERVVADDFTLTEFDCVGFMRQIMDGVRFIHSRNIIHLDLKPENILCLTRSTYSIKIIDFGLSQKYDPGVQLRVLFGTPEFVAPEIINYEPISPASDMWALGVITYVLLSGLSPFMGDTDSETFANITSADFDFEDDAFATISTDAKEFISALLVKRQEKRLTAEQCLSHKWLAYPEPTKNIVIPTDKLKRFIIRRKWQKTGNAIRALGRITMLYSTRRSSEAAAAAATASSATSTDSGICISPTTENSSATFGTETRLAESESKRVLQRQARVDSSGLT